MNDTRKYRNSKGWISRYGYSCGMTEIRRVGNYRIEITKDAFAWFVDVDSNQGLHTEHIDFTIGTLDEAREIVMRIIRLIRKGEIDPFDRLSLWNKIHT